MKTRDIRDHIKSKGFEVGVIYCLEAMNESILGLATNVIGLAQDQNKIIDTLGGVVNIAGAMKDEMVKIMEGDDGTGLGPNTNSLDKMEQ